MNSFNYSEVLCFDFVLILIVFYTNNNRYYYYGILYSCIKCVIKCFMNVLLL